jgi:cytochrome c peroxidase
LHGVGTPTVTIAKCFAGVCLAASALWACSTTFSRKTDLAQSPPWEAANPKAPLPRPPLGIDLSFSSLAEPPTPERVRLGRWLYYDRRLSANGEISCATCHRPESGFSEPTPVATGIGRQKGTRKTPSLLNQAWTLYPHFFWDGRASSLEEQVLGPIANPIEMGNTHQAMIAETKTFKDEGRTGVSKMPEDIGAFKTPGLRDVAKRAPYMHDGSLATLRDVVRHCNKGGIQNPYLSPKLKMLKLTEAEEAALVKFMEALSGEGYMDTAPAAYPQ